MPYPTPARIVEMLGIFAQHRASAQVSVLLPSSRRSIVMQSSTGQTSEHKLAYAVFDDFRHTAAVDWQCNGLVGAVVAGNVAELTAYALVGVDAGHHFVMRKFKCFHSTTLGTALPAKS